MFYFGYAIDSGLGNQVEIELSKKLMKLWGEFGNTGVPSLSAIDQSFEWINFNPGYFCKHMGIQYQIN